MDAADVGTSPRDSGLPVVLALVGYYPPAFLAGGPLRSVPGIVEHLSASFRFLVITRDRDLGASAPLAGVVRDRWAPCGSGRCLYLSPGRRLRGGLLGAIRRTRHDILYLNSLFSIQFGLVPLLLRRLRLVPRRGLVMAPRGELDDAALALKRRRKRAYLWLVHRLRLLDDAVWHAATDPEAECVRREFGSRVRVEIAHDIPVPPGAEASPPPKHAGALEVVFLSRISRMKNLDFAIRALMGVHARVQLNVFGPIEDRAYWAECERLAAALPANVTLSYRGPVAPDRTTEVFSRHHLLLLPSRGESFGHAIVESLLAGCPVLISDQTPWHGLESRQAGSELPLDAPEGFAATIDQFAAMPQAEFDDWSAGARRLGREIAEDPAVDAAYDSIFTAALKRMAGGASSSRA